MENTANMFQRTKEAFDMVPQSDQIQARKVHLLGFEFDGTACFRKGAALGPDAIRMASPGLESYSPYLQDDLEELSNYVCDLGNLKIASSDNCEEQFLHTSKNLTKCIQTQNLKLDKSKFLLLGGEHSVSFGQVKEYLNQYQDLVILHLDAHADLRDGYEGFHYSHASIMKRCLDHFEPTHRLIQFGIRSGTKAEFNWMSEQNTLVNNRNSLIEILEKIPVSRPIYLTLDLDFFDPSFLPGTGTPEPGGEDFHFFIKLIKILKLKNFVGADVVELAPLIDPTGNSSVFAAKIVRELLISLTRSLK
jgi:agmatinase